MAESSNPKARSVLLLDNRQADAHHLCELLQALPHWHINTTVHLFSEGIFPTVSNSFDLLLVTDDYAGSKLSQIIDIANFYQPHAQLVLLGTRLPEARSPQEFIDAGRAGVSYWLQKDNVSPDILHAMLLRIFSDSNQHPRTTMLKSPASGLPATDAAMLAPVNSDRSVEQASAIVAEISVGIVVVGVANNDFIYRHINHAAAESMRHNPQELIGKRLTRDAAILENFDLPKVLQQVSTNATTQTHRLMSLDDDISANWREIVIRPLTNGDLLVEIHNITERVRAAAERRYREKIWWHIAKSLPDLCAILDADGSVNRVIAGEWQQLNIDSETLPGQLIAAILAPDEREQCSTSIHKALNTGKTQTAVYALDSTENQTRLHVKVALLHAEVNAPRQLLWIARDLNGSRAELQNASNTFNGTSELLTEMLQRAPFIAAISSANGHYEYINPHCSQFLQQPAEAVIGKTDAELFSVGIAQTLHQLDQKLLSEGIAQQSEIALSADRSTERYHIIKIPLNGAYLATQSILTFALPASTSVEKTYADADKHSQQQAASQPEMINDLVGDIARDFNDVLVNLTEHTRVALTDSDSQPGGEITSYLNAVMNSSQRARDLVAQLMTHQTPAAGPVKPDAADLTLFVSGIVGLLRTTIGQHLQISSDLQQNLRVTDIDSLRLQNALVQLFRVAQPGFDASGQLSVCLRTLTQQEHECAYCYGKIKGDFVVMSLHSRLRTNADTIETDESGLELPQDEGLLSQIKRIHELLTPYSGHIVLRGAAEKDQSWYVFLATDPAMEHSLKIVPPLATD